MAFDKLNTLIDSKPFSLNNKEKKVKFINAVREVTLHHYNNCLPYKKLCDKRQFSPDLFNEIEELPYLPTNIFKDSLLLSVPEDAIIRNIKSSATSTGRPSSVALDRDTNKRQIKCFNKVVTDRIGSQRFKFIILDESSAIGRSSIVTARASTIRSLLFCSKEAHTCVFEGDGKLCLDEAKLDRLLREAEESKEEIIIFGFTFILYKYAVRALIESKKKISIAGLKSNPYRRLEKT
jgi:hypothetical protein